MVWGADFASHGIGVNPITIQTLNGAPVRGKATTGLARTWAIALAVYALLLPALLGGFGPVPVHGGADSSLLAGEVCAGGHGTDRVPDRERHPAPPDCCLAGCMLLGGPPLAPAGVLLPSVHRFARAVAAVVPAAKPLPRPRGGRPPEPRAPPLTV